jgi:hypothetical protein
MLRDEQTNGIIAPLLERIAELERQLEQARKDEARYQWLTADHPKHDTRVKVYEIARNLNMNRKGHIDAAIDAAIQSKEKP